MKKNRVNQANKKTGRPKENLVGKTVGCWIVRKEREENVFYCEHRVSGIAKLVHRNALFASRHYTKLRDFYEFAQEYIRTHSIR